MFLTSTVRPIWYSVCGRSEAAERFMLKKPEPIPAAMRCEPKGWHERMHPAIATH